MLKLYSKFRALWATRDKGASAVEYALLVAGIAVVIMATVFLLGGAINTEFKNVCNQVGGAGKCP